MRLSFQKVCLAALGLCLMLMIYLIILDGLFQKFDINHTGPILLDTPHRRHEPYKSLDAQTVHVCLSSDHNTIIGATATINSIRQNTNHQVVFHLITLEDVVQDLRNWIDNSELKDIHYEVKVFDPGVMEGKVKVRQGRPELALPMNYVRFYYPEIFPDLHGKVIHVDDDTIIKGDIYELFKVRMKDGHIAAFSEDCSSSSKRFTQFASKYSSYINFNKAEVQKLRMKPSECSFNTGVYVFDVDEWRRQNITSQLEHWMELNAQENIYGNERGGGGSQPPMMIVLYKKYTKLDPMWNVRYLGWTSARRYSKHFIEHAKLLHWNGGYKPWGGVSQYANVWDRYSVPDPSGKYKPVRKRRKHRN